MENTSDSRADLSQAKRKQIECARRLGKALRSPNDSLKVVTDFAKTIQKLPSEGTPETIAAEITGAVYELILDVDLKKTEYFCDENLNIRGIGFVDQHGSSNLDPKDDSVTAAELDEVAETIVTFVDDILNYHQK
jgi:hypothetical protein